MNDYWAKYANVLDPTARECYNKKLEHGDGFSKLLDLYFVQNGGRTTQPLTRLNVRHYAINKSEMFNQESVKAYKSRTSTVVRSILNFVL